MRIVPLVSPLMAAGALCAAALLYMKVERLERDLGKARAAPREVARTDGPGSEGTFSLPETGGRFGTPDSETVMGSPAGGSDSPEARPSTPEARLAQLEKELKTLREERAASPARWGWSPPRFARSVDDLAQQLSLTTTQKSRIEVTLERGRQRIQDVLKIPDETGKSPFERRAEAKKKLDEAMKNPPQGGGLGHVLAFTSDFMSYHDKKIPGRSETYGQEVNRIRKETRDEMATALDAKQRETFEQTNVDGLMGEGGGAQVAFSLTRGSDDAVGEVMIETGEVTEELEPAQPPSGDGR